VADPARRYRKAVRRALALALVLTLAACGGGGNRLSKAKYAARANAICARFNRQVRSLGGAENLKALARLSERTLPALDSTTQKLRRLHPPKDEEATVKAWVASLERLHADVVAIRDRARANDLAGMQRLVPGASRDNRHSDDLANRLGATTCSKSQT
jgi:hypothetical protein